MKLLTTLPSLVCMRGPNVLKMRATLISTLSCVGLNELFAFTLHINKKVQVPCFVTYTRTSLFRPPFSPFGGYFHMFKAVVEYERYE